MRRPGLGPAPGSPPGPAPDPDLASLAALHAAAFAGTGRGWSAAEIAALAAAPGAVMRVAGAPPAGFALARVAAGEAELLTLAVDPARQGGGVGRALLSATLQAARAAGATALWLEVAADNARARALYAAAGFAAAGVRRGYFRTAGRPAVDALVLRAAL